MAVEVRMHPSERRILIVNLAKGKVGRENARFLGTFLAAELAGAAAARSTRTATRTQRTPPRAGPSSRL